jgi:hypothetical protein
MTPSREQDDALLLILGGVGGYVVAVCGDRLVVRKGRAVVCSRLVDGLADFLRRHDRRVRLRLDRTPNDEAVLALVGADGFGWAENLTHPSRSEWTYFG